jgi:5-formyltetrahydrofolate cyclo-ligase
MKHAIRKEILKKLRSQSPGERLRKSDLIKEQLFQEEEFKKAQCVMLYVSTDEEVDTKRMIDETLEMGKKVCVPVVVKGSKRIIASELKEHSALQKGPYGIYQPAENSVRAVPLEDIDLVVVPGVAFDAHKVRLGRGHGYYDRFLSDLPKGTRTIGLAFDFQVVEKLPRDSHDIPVSKTITA